MNILIVDDHPLNVDSYTSILSTIETDQELYFHPAYNCEQAYNLIYKLKNSTTNLDIALLDISLPAYTKKNLHSGEEVGSLIQKEFPNCTIIIITMHSEPIWVNRILKNLNPDGFISKSDLNYKVFPEIINAIQNKKNYYSKSIIEAQKEFAIKNLQWDEHDSKILQLISEGIKTKKLPDYIPLSLSAIEKRKANLKKQLIFNRGSDDELIEKAKKMGLFSLTKMSH